MGQPFVGEIRMVGFNFAPQGWAFCDGRIMSIAENDVLFTLIGTTYGGDGQTTFALPNLQSRVPTHIQANNMNLLLGKTGGVESVTLNTQQLPAHTHLPQCYTTAAGAANSANPSGNFWASWADTQFSDQAPAPAGNMNAGAVGNAGGGQPHDNMLPFLAINFIISLFGIFPSQT